MRKRHLTVIIVPEAERMVRRFRTSRFTLLFLAVTLLFTLSAFFIWLGSEKQRYDQTIDILTDQIAADAHSHQRELSVKEARIEQLQQKIIELSEQTEEVRGKLRELEKLESEIESLTGVKVPETADTEASVRAAGGVFQPADVEQILQLAEQTGTSLGALSQSLTEMADKLNMLIDELYEKKHLESITPSIWPTESSRISSGYGFRLDPFTRRSAFHSGIDIDGTLNDPIYATAEGVVAETGRTSELGNYIIIDHSQGLKTLYAHLNKILVQRNDHVEKGDLIGRMGSTGRSTGPHLHYEVHKNGSPVDPRTYIPD
jgi:murein DD-endopeptidase MepM/ murein hydrolase activator NlpD